MVGPSGEEATAHSSGSTPLFLIFSILHRNIYLKLLFFLSLSFSSLLASFLTDDSAEEEASKIVNKGREGY